MIAIRLLAMPLDLQKDLEPLLATLARSFAIEGNAREVALLATGTASIEQTDFDNWDGGTYGYTVYLQVPAPLYAQLEAERDKLEEKLKERLANLVRGRGNVWIQACQISTEIVADPRWRNKAKDWLQGKGITNQGRVRSDNIASRTCDGLLFRSEPEINLYRALKSAGVSFAPLPVFVRGGESYRRIEPDFIVIKEGVVLVVEVDGDTVHHETPVDAHNRTTMLVHEGAHLERIRASECDTPEKAAVVVQRLLGILAKIKSSRA